MTSVYDVDFIRELLSREDDETGGEFVSELHYESEGNQISFEYVNDDVPPNWTFRVVAVNDERNYDSYGNSMAASAYVIIAVSDGEDTATYKLPGGYGSYEGWDWELAYLKEVAKQEKIVTTWEWTAI